MRKLGSLKPKKELGQNFLTNKKIVEDIVAAAELEAGDIVLEVGPGKGVLTEELLKKAGKVIAVEKDGELVEFLRGKFKEEIERGKLVLIEGDILDMKFQITNNKLQTNSKLKIKNSKTGKENTIYSIQNTTYKIVANLPYYITSHFLRKFLESDNQPSLMVLMIQDEVAKRIVAKKVNPAERGKESILSISVKAYGHPEIVRKVSAGNFFPVPKVDSAVLKISGISKDFFSTRTVLVEIGEVNEQDFFALVRAGFSGKRKMLKNNLANFAKTKSYPSRRLRSAPRLQTSGHSEGLSFGVGDNFKKCGISEKARAEGLKLEDWKCLCENFKSNLQNT